MICRNPFNSVPITEFIEPHTMALRRLISQLSIDCMFIHFKAQNLRIFLIHKNIVRPCGEGRNYTYLLGVLSGFIRMVFLGARSAFAYFPWIHLSGENNPLNSICRLLSTSARPHSLLTSKCGFGQTFITFLFSGILTGKETGPCTDAWACKQQQVT